MNGQAKVSVIIPVYNVEKYLSECLDSICGQTFKDIEIICVDDCSTDASYNILKEYAYKDQRIAVISNKVNCGLSYARNCGLKHAVGKYVYFIDSDDLLDENAIQEMYDRAENNQLDVILFEAEVFWEGEKPEYEAHPYLGTKKGTYKGVFSGKELIKKLLMNGDLDSCVWLQFWRKAYLQEKELQFKEGMLHEDLIFSFKAIFDTSRAEAIQKKYYRYRRRSDSITRCSHIERSIEGYALAYLEIIKLKDKFEGDEQLITGVISYLKILEWEIRQYYKEIIEKGSYHPQIMQDTLACYFSQFFIKDMDKRYLNYIEDNKLAIIKQFHKIIIYGAGMIAHDVIEILSEYNIGIYKVVVSNIEQEQYIYGHKIWTIESLPKQDRTIPVLVCVGRKSYEQVVETLRAYRFEKILYALPDEKI